MNLSTGYEPTSGNTLPAAVIFDGVMDVDLPLGVPIAIAPTTPPRNQSNQTMSTAVVHHGAPLSAAPFYGGGGSAAAIALPSGSHSQTHTSNQLIPFQVNVNLPQTGSPAKAELQNEISLLKQHMLSLNMELYQAQMIAAQTSGHESQFQARAAEIMARFEATAEEAKHIWSEAHEVSMGMQKAESQKEYISLKNEAGAHIAKLTEKLEATQRQAREFQANKEQEFQAKAKRLEAEMLRREAELKQVAQAQFDQQKGSHNQEVQAKNLEIHQNILRLNQQKLECEAREQQVAVRLQEVNHQTELQRQALQETLTAKQSIEINAHQLSITCETERGILSNEASKLQSIIDEQAATVKQFQQRDQNQAQMLAQIQNQHAQKNAQDQQEKQYLETETERKWAEHLAEKKARWLHEKAELQLQFDNVSQQLQSIKDTPQLTTSQVEWDVEGKARENVELQAQLNKLLQEKAVMQEQMQSQHDLASSKSIADPTHKRMQSVPKRTTVSETPEVFILSPTPKEKATLPNTESVSSSEESSDEEDNTQAKYTDSEWRQWYKTHPPTHVSDSDDESSEEAIRSEHEKKKKEFREIFPLDGRIRKGDIPKAHEAESISFDNWPSHRKEKTWRTDTFRTIATSSVDPDNCFKWLIAIKKAVSIKDLPKTPIIFKQLEPKILKAGIKCCKEPFKTDIKTLVRKAQENEDDPRLLPGSEIFWLMLQEMKRTIPEQTATSYREILHVKLKNNDMRKFLEKWTSCLEDAIEDPPESLLATLFIEQIEQCEPFQEHWEHVTLPLIVKNEARTYKFAMSAVTVWLEQKKAKDKAKSIKQANESAWDDQETPKWASPGWIEKPKFKRGDCHTYFNKGKCADETCGFNHENTLHQGGKGKSKGKGKKGDGKREASSDITCFNCGKKGHKSAECRGRSQSREPKGKGKGQESKGKGKGDNKGKGKGKRSSSDGKPRPCKTCGNTGHKTADCKDNAPKCVAHYKSDCTTSGCQKWHPPVCLFWEKGTCTKTAHDCIFLHRTTTWSKPRNASPASNTTYEKPRADSPSPQYTTAQKKEYKAAIKAEEEIAAAKKEKRKASKARKKAAGIGAVAVTASSHDGLSPLNL